MTKVTELYLVEKTHHIKTSDGKEYYYGSLPMQPYIKWVGLNGIDNEYIYTLQKSLDETIIGSIVFRELPQGVHFVGASILESLRRLDKDQRYSDILDRIPAELLGQLAVDNAHHKDFKG
ncbi:hypothetical protein [Azospirillum sp. Sh1]|uniref:hypothetical protein n=1 Tax=Azospirillum sp. Sh1 TaxID=2607285 RepID=UPI0011EFE63C|nr:hypothetical protein [Azospirillum sp. Sh1]KAA0573406.1 hypothetical protein FZ029_20730 [Azospirillum sp. Sh1]